MTKKPTRTEPNKPSRVQIAKDLRRDVKDLRHAGWSLRTGGNHMVLICPDGRHTVPIPRDSAGTVRDAFRVAIRRHAATCGQ